MINVMLFKKPPDFYRIAYEKSAPRAGKAQAAQKISGRGDFHPLPSLFV